MMPGTLRKASASETAPCDRSKALLTMMIDCATSRESAGSLPSEMPPPPKSLSSCLPCTVTGSSVAAEGPRAPATTSAAGDGDSAQAILI